jgi:hypothetical protein
MNTPPEMPPPSADPMVWALARQVWLDHMPDTDGFCQLCKTWAPCAPRTNASIVIALGARAVWQVYPYPKPS